MYSHSVPDTKPHGNKMAGRNGEHHGFSYFPQHDANNNFQGIISCEGLREGSSFCSWCEVNGSVCSWLLYCFSSLVTSR